MSAFKYCKRIHLLLASVCLFVCFLCYHHRMRLKPVSLTIAAAILQLLLQWETSYRLVPMLVPGLAFSRGLLPCLEHATLLCRSISLRHLWSSSHCLCSIRWKLFMNHSKEKAGFCLSVLAVASTHSPMGADAPPHACFWVRCVLRDWLLLG